MKKYIHPKTSETLIQLRDGSFYLKKWLYFKSFLQLEVDYTSNIIWKKKNCESLVKVKNKINLR